MILPKADMVLQEVLALNLLQAYCTHYPLLTPIIWGDPYLLSCVIPAAVEEYLSSTYLFRVRLTLALLEEKSSFHTGLELETLRLLDQLSNQQTRQKFFETNRFKIIFLNFSLKIQFQCQNVIFRTQQLQLNCWI